MNLRQQKRYNLALMSRNNGFGLFPLPGTGSLLVAFKEGMDLERRVKKLEHKAAVLEEAIAIKEAVKAAKQEFVCVKVKDGTVVGTFDTVGPAFELLQKHARQKKAKLQVMDTSTGELVPFEEA